jgi:signal transduction histidine kinase/ActR/RegA family two-component response regulator
MFNLTRYYSIASLVCIIIAATVLVLFDRYQFIRELMVTAESQNITLTSVFRNSLLPQVMPLLDSQLVHQDPRSRPEIVALQREVIALMRDTLVVKIKIYNLRGITVFSTAFGQIGEIKSGNAGFIAAAAGSVASELSHRATFSAFEQVIEDRDMLSSYIPLRGKGGRIEGVLEVYSDVTPFLARVWETEWRLFTAVFLVLTMLYALLYLVVRRAKQIIVGQQQELKTSLALIEASNQLLDQRVQERTAALWESNQSLEAEIIVRTQAEEAQRLAATQLAEKVEDLQRMQARLIETERLQAMGQMAAGVAHDFNNALMGVLGQAQLMQLALEREPGAIALNTFLLECLARQEQAAQDAAETVRKIRGATRPRDMEAFAPVSLGEIVEQVLAITQPRWKDQAEAAGVRITVQTALAKTPPVLGHAAELREALTNLFFNALDAMSQGGTLTITTRQVSGSEVAEARAPDPGTESVREWVEVTVTDTGGGMPPAVQARVFEPFFTTKGVRGTGLGLSMVMGIISRHEGEITVQSTEGQGTTFTLRLPVAQVAVAEVVPPPTAQIPLTGSLNLLVIDDEPLLAETLGDLLRLLGHEAAIVTSGEEGLTRLASTRFDMVLTDLGMPGMSGWEVAQAVKTRWPQLPVILVTGWGDVLEHARLEGTGVDVVLSKPYTVTQITHALVQGFVLTQQGGATDLEPDRLPPSNA